MGSPSGTVLESRQALGNLLPSRIALPARSEGPQGTSQGSLNSPDKGLCSWLVYAVQNTPGLNAPPAPPGIQDNSKCWEQGQYPQLLLREEFVVAASAVRLEAERV